MDLEEWELLPDDGFLEIHDDGGKKIFSRKFAGTTPKSSFNMNYFICPSPDSQKIAVPKQALPVPVELGPSPGHDSGEEVIKVPIELSVLPSVTSEKAEQDTVSQVFFKKLKENEFVDMKMDSPRSSSSRGMVLPQIETGSFQFEEKMKIERETEGNKNRVDSDRKEKVEEEEEEKSGGLNIWKWSFTGIGAICTFGVAAAATFCIVIIGSHHKTKQMHQQNHKFQFQSYTHDKRIKQVVRHATKLNEAISAVRGVPLTRAQITIGGYYDGL